MVGRRGGSGAQMESSRKRPRTDGRAGGREQAEAAEREWRARRLSEERAIASVGPDAAFRPCFKARSNKEERRGP